MNTVFLEIVFVASDYAKMGIHGRDDIEDPLSDALTSADIGEVTGGGAGSGTVIVDIEIENEANLSRGLQIIREVLRTLRCPPSTIIKRAKPSGMIYKIYDEE
jgi:hypothetical protein